MKVVLKTLAIGIAGTFSTDIWIFILKFFGVHSHGLLLVGIWVTSYLPLSLQNQLSGKELLIGWTVHYFLGISFAFLLILTYGKKRFQKPTVSSALLLGLITFIFSLFIIQPILNFGVAFSKYSTQPVILLKVLVFHSVYSMGLYALSQILKVRNVRLDLKSVSGYGN